MALAAAPGTRVAPRHPFVGRAIPGRSGVGRVLGRASRTGFIQTKGRFIQPRRLARQMRMRLGVFVRVPDDEAPPEYCSRRENVRA